jgi:lysophospholipid acyltransferase (LPLAT)-like uncharacterized protein
MNMWGGLLRWLILGIGRSLRWRVEDPHGLLRQLPDQPVIFAVWHNRLFLMPYLFHRYWTHRPRGKLAVMVSASKDGEKLVRILERFDWVCVRGSTSRRGQAALLELTRYVQDGYDAGITPDGPRGPRYRVAAGVISLAQVTGRDIIPLGWEVSRKWQLRSWDRFQIPLPWSRATLRIGAPVRVDRQADEADRERKRAELEQVMKELAGD